MRIPRSLIALLAAAACAAPVSLSMAQTGPPVEGKAAMHLVEAEKYTAAGDYRAAIIELKNAVLEAPWSPRLHKELGATYLAIGDGASAEKELRRAIDRDPEWVAPRLLLAEAWLSEGEADKVLNELWAAEAPPGEDRARVHVLHGRAHLQKGDTQGAREAFKQALEQQADHAPAYLGMARAALQEGEPSMAQLHLDNAEQGQGADRADVLELKGQLAAERGDYEAAEAAYRAAVELEPQHIQRQIPLAGAQIEQGKFDEADAALDKVLSLHPGDGTALYYRAYGAYRRGDADTALTYANQLMNAGAKEPAVLFVAGASAFYAQRNELAVGTLERYLAQVPEDPAALVLLGRTYLRLDDSAKALGRLRPHADRPDADADLLIVAGIAALRAGDAAAGSGYIARAADLRTGNERLRLLAGAAKLSAGDREGAFAELEGIAESSGGSRALDLGLLEERLHRAEFEQAIPLAERYQQRYPERPEGWALGGIALARTGELEAARKAFERALELRPGYPDAGTGLAEIALREGDTQAARRALEGVLKYYPDNEKLLINLANLELKAGAADAAVGRLEGALEASPESEGLRLALARAYLHAGRPLKAIEASAAGTDPGGGLGLLEIRGEAELRAGRNDDALETFQRLADARPDSATAHAALASALEAKGDLEKALDEYDRALALDPNLPEARIGQARVRFLRLPFPVQPEAFNAEVDRIAGLAKEYPDRAGLVRLAALVDMFAGRPEKAVQKLGSLYRATGDPETAMRLADAQKRAGRAQEARATLEGHLKDHPEEVAVRVGLAELLVALDEFAAAADQLERVRALEPQRAEIRAALGWALMRAGRLDEAEPHARAAYATRPDDPAVLHTMGIVYLEEGSPGEAESFLAGAMRAGRASPRLRLDYARALERNGKDDQAKSVLEQLLALQRAFPERAEAHRLLNSLPD